MSLPSEAGQARASERHGAGVRKPRAQQRRTEPLSDAELLDVRNSGAPLTWDERVRRTKLRRQARRRR